MLATPHIFGQCCKTCTSEYSNDHHSWLSAPNSFLASALPRTLLGELTALPQTSSWFKRVLLLRGRGGKRRGRKKRKGKGMKREGRVRKGG